MATSEAEVAEMLKVIEGRAIDIRNLELALSLSVHREGEKSVEIREKAESIGRLDRVIEGLTLDIDRMHTTIKVQAEVIESQRDTVKDVTATMTEASALLITCNREMESCGLTMQRQRAEITRLREKCGEQAQGGQLA